MNADGRRLKDSGRDGGRSISVHQRSSAVASDVAGFRVTAWDLLEYSCVPVPANFQALTHELKRRRITAPALVKSLAPLGFEAPDLVPTPIRQTNRDVQDMQDGERQEEPCNPCPSMLEAVDVPQAVTGTARITSKDIQDEQHSERKESCESCPSLLKVVDVSEAVSRAFDLWLLRARGGV